MSFGYIHIKMGRSRFPGKPLKFQNRKRISVLSGTVYHETAAEGPPARSVAANDFAGEQEVKFIVHNISVYYKYSFFHNFNTRICCVYVISTSNKCFA